MSELTLDGLSRCFQGLIPCVLATTSASGVPNITYLSQILYVDQRHIGLSRQFFNKTRQNLEQSPFACIQMHDALTYEAYRLNVRYLRSETSGPFFEEQSARLDAIASHTGMSGVFRLQAIDICEVLDIEHIEGFLLPAESSSLPAEFERGPLTELRALQLVSARINRAVELDALLTDTLAAFAELLGLPHSMVLLPDETDQRLVAIASHGYGASGVGAEVRVGDGLIGLAAANRRLLRISGLRNELRYSIAARERLREVAGQVSERAEVSLPGLPNAESQLALPLLVGDELVGVLSFESASGVAFQTWHEAFLQLLANQLASGIVRLREERAAGVEGALGASAPRSPATPVIERRKRSFSFFKNDDCIFVDGEYLVRNVPARILWKLLAQHVDQGRVEFNNRELRLDPTLGLPPVRTNLESRLVLLRKRLAEKCADLQIVPGERGRFRLVVGCELELIERDHA
ncbi:MAG: GAF domain-containing protein [Pseudomonadota bacterium]